MKSRSHTAWPGDPGSIGHSTRATSSSESSHIESSSASHYGEYDITGVTDLTEETYETAHGGYDPVYANEDPDRVLPVDVLRDMEKEGVIGSVASAKAFAAEYSQKLKADGVDAVILTST